MSTCEHCGDILCERYMCHEFMEDAYGRCPCGMDDPEESS